MHVSLIWLHAWIRLASGALVEMPRQVFLHFSPLVGLPKSLRFHVHSACFIETGEAFVGWDFVPMQPSDAKTIQRLLTLQSCPAAIRELQVNNQEAKNFIPVGECSPDFLDVDEVYSPESQFPIGLLPEMNVGAK